MSAQKNNYFDVFGNEAEFSFEEIFFSRTDARGIIHSGNSVFQRVSVFSWEEMLGKPHNIVRNSDMPRAVFWLMWSKIKKGEPIGAYVKNKSKDGKFYWVFAIVTPINGGFLSVRIKPSSELFTAIESEYRNICAYEQSDNKITPEESAVFLLKRLNEHGFRNYEEFMSEALAKEVLCRDKELKRNEDIGISQFQSMLKNAKQLSNNTENIFRAFAENEYVPLNLRIQSAQLGEEGATIGVISNNYSVISNEIKTYITQFLTSAKEVYDHINNGMFLLVTSKIQIEALAFFKNESVPDEINKEQELRLLEIQKNEYAKKALEGLKMVHKQCNNFRKDCAEMKRLASSLEVIRVMGKVESSRLKVVKDGLNELIDDLEKFQTTVSDNLKSLDQSSRFTEHNINRLIKNFAACA
jgi:hypothetical protein